MWSPARNRGFTPDTPASSQFYTRSGIKHFISPPTLQWVNTVNLISFLRELELLPIALLLSNERRETFYPEEKFFEIDRNLKIR